jgi:transposase InsO family protein
MDSVRFILLCLAGWINRQQQDAIDYLQEEVAVLREQLGPRCPKFTDAQRRRLAVRARKLKFGKLKEIASIVTPQTLFAWHRKLIAKKYDSSEGRIGRPRTKVDVAGLVVKFAKENSGWGYGSIEGALLNLGHDIGRSTIARILKQAGVPIAPKRKGEMSWEEFLRAHWEVMAATDFFTTEIWTMQGLVRYHVLFVIRLATREVKVVGVIPEPNGEWMKQMARNLVDCETGFLLGYKYLIQDRGTAYTKDFRELLGNSGVRSIRLPRKSPKLNCYAERWVRSVREMCVDRMIFFGEKSLRHAMSEVEIFYNHERPHQGLENKIIKPDFDKPKKEGDIECRSRLGGLMKYYFRKAA